MKRKAFKRCKLYLGSNNNKKDFTQSFVLFLQQHMKEWLFYMLQNHEARDSLCLRNSVQSDSDEM